MELFNSPFWGLSITVGAYIFGVWLKNKVKITLFNPLIIAVVVIIAILLLLPIDYEAYLSGAGIISIFLFPATVCLAIPIYHKRDLLKKHWLPIVTGCVVGAAVCIACVWLLGNLMNLDEVLTISLLPKSITAPFGIEISEAISGIPAVTVMSIVFTGLTGAILAPVLIKLLRIKNSIAIGLAIGVSSHVTGTTRALEIGETEGAMSGLAISITGIVTVVILLLMYAM